MDEAPSVTIIGRYFAEMHSGKARQVLGNSQHPTKGLEIKINNTTISLSLFLFRYPLAITSINITQMVYSLLSNDSLDYYLYQKSRANVATINDFMEAYCE